MLDKLQSLAKSKLLIVQPISWDTDAHKVYLADATAAYPKASSKDLADAWKNAIAIMQEEAPKTYAEYASKSRFALPEGCVRWNDVKLLSGVTDGDQYALVFQVGKEETRLECTNAQLDDPLFIDRQLRHYTGQNIEAPYLSKSKRSRWWGDVVQPWLASGKIKRAARQMTNDSIEDAIREFCLQPLFAEDVPGAFRQSKSPIVEASEIYVPFSGCLAYVQQRLGKSNLHHSLTTALKKMGAEKKQKRHGKYQRLWFFVLPYENNEITEAGRWQDDGAPEGSQGDDSERRDSLSSDIRQEKRGGHAAEDGVLDQGGVKPATDNNDPWGGFSEPESGQEQTPDTIPF